MRSRFIVDLSSKKVLGQLLAIFILILHWSSGMSRVGEKVSQAWFTVAMVSFRRTVEASFLRMNLTALAVLTFIVSIISILLLSAICGGLMLRLISLSGGELDGSAFLIKRRLYIIFTY